MSVDELPSGRALRAWAYMSTVRNAVFVLAWVLVYLLAVVPFDAMRLLQFSVLVALVLGCILIAAIWLVAWLMGPVSRYLDATNEERTDPELLHEAFRNVMDLPRLIFILVCCYWLFGGTAVALLVVGIGTIAFFVLWISLGVVFVAWPDAWVWYMQCVVSALMKADRTLGMAWQTSNIALVAVLSAPVFGVAALAGAATAWKMKCAL